MTRLVVGGGVDEGALIPEVIPSLFLFLSLFFVLGNIKDKDYDSTFSVCLC